MSAVLLAIKPHLCYLFWLALLCWAVRERRWKLLAAGAGLGAVLTAVPLAFDSALLQHYGHAFTSQPPSQYRSPTLAHCIRMALDPNNFRLQFLAMLPGLAWFIPWFLRKRDCWEWRDQLPWLLLISLLTTAYGGWPFDLVLLLVPVVHIAAQLQSAARGKWMLAVALHLTLGLFAVCQIAAGVEYFWFIWLCPALLTAYLCLNAPGQALNSANLPRLAKA